MKAIAVSKYGPVENLVATELPEPGKPEGHDVLIRYLLHGFPSSSTII